MPTNSKQQQQIFPFISSSIFGFDMVDPAVRALQRVVGGGSCIRAADWEAAAASMQVRQRGPSERRRIQAQIQGRYGLQAFFLFFVCFLNLINRGRQQTASDKVRLTMAFKLRWLKKPPRLVVCYWPSKICLGLQPNKPLVTQSINQLLSTQPISHLVTHALRPLNHSATKAPGHTVTPPITRPLKQ